MSDVVSKHFNFSFGGQLYSIDTASNFVYIDLSPKNPGYMENIKHTEIPSFLAKFEKTFNVRIINYLVESTEIWLTIDKPF